MWYGCECVLGEGGAGGGGSRQASKGVLLLWDVTQEPRRLRCRVAAAKPPVATLMCRSSAAEPARCEGAAMPPGIPSHWQGTARQELPPEAGAGGQRKRGIGRSQRGASGAPKAQRGRPAGTHRGRRPRRQRRSAARPGSPGPGPPRRSAVRTPAHPRTGQNTSFDQSIIREKSVFNRSIHE